MKKKICVITGSRAEYGTMYHTLKLIRSSPALELQLVVTGMHLSPEFGYTVNEILKDGFEIADRVEMMISSDTTAAIGKSIGVGIIGMVDCLSRLKPDIVLVVADRYEIFAAAAAAMALQLPIAHVSGGELTEGLMDEQIRHAITKMSHVHFVAIEENAERVLQMGEEPWRVHIVGGHWIDNIKKIKKISLKGINAALGMRLSHPSILVTYHAVNRPLARTEAHIKNLLDALDKVKADIIFTYPNADAGGRVIVSAIEKFVKSHPRAKLYKSLGKDLYLNLFSHVDIVVGNSSSGLLETQSFRLPVVNIGDRQAGRMITENIISVPEERDAILQGIRKGLSKEFRKSIANMENPFDKGCAAKNIVKVLTELDPGPKLLNKRFASV
jgi:GDP/UDP-N,N'-diacetylbacillosamine 2-epimerase (hydrolysing)